MSQDNKVIGFMSPADLAALMSETGQIAVQGTVAIDGRPVIQASVKVMNSRTGEQLPGGLPFAVVLFKGPGEPGYSNVAIGSSVPFVDLGITLPPDFFNRCNRNYRFLRAYPLDQNSFVLQMDLFLRFATREYVKFCFDLWAAGFSQILFALFGQQEGEDFAPAAEVYAAMPQSALEPFAAATMEELAMEAVEAPASEVIPEASPVAAAEEALTLEAEAAIAAPATEPPQGDVLLEQPVVYDREAPLA